MEDGRWEDGSRFEDEDESAMSANRSMFDVGRSMFDVSG